MAKDRGKFKSLKNGSTEKKDLKSNPKNNLNNKNIRNNTSVN